MLQSAWQIGLLGDFSLREASRDVSPSVTLQMALLLAILADRVGKQHQRSDLIEELWPNVESEVGRNRFRVLLTTTRRLLEPPGTPVGSVLKGDRSQLELSPNACEVDVDAFQRLIQLAGQASSSQDRIRQFKAADEIYRGDFLSGRSGEWIEARRMHYARLQSRAQFQYSALLEESGDVEGAMRQIARSIEADPLREAPRRRGLRLMVETGNPDAAIAEFDAYRKLLKRSVGLAPTAEFQDWVRDVKTRSGSKRVVGPVEQTSSDVIEEEFATPSVETARIALPPPLTSFVGRAEDIGELSDILPLYRWITLVGSGGIGKTRLAIETARANSQLFGGGIVFVPVAEASNPSNLLDIILRQMGLDASTNPLETLRLSLSQSIERGRNACLFVFDEIDHLSTEANQVTTRLLAEVPNATILATARKGRGAPGEHVYKVRPLEIPDDEAPMERLMSNASVRLFFDRAQGSSSRFTVTRANAQDVIALCRRLDGIPLAIELAAAQTGTTPPNGILQKLDDLGSLNDAKGWREPRHRSLQASLAFSFDALEPKDRTLFCALCVFPGSFESKAAAMVAGATPDDLSRLVDHSLLNRVAETESQRYAMLGMVREFGWSKLSDAERVAVQERHAAYYRQMILDESTLHVSSGILQLPKLRWELDNLRLAANWLLKKRDVESATRFAAGLVSLWVFTGFQQEGREYVRQIRESLPVDRLQDASLNSTEGILACMQDDSETGREKSILALEVFEEFGMKHAAAMIRWTIAYTSYLAGNFEECLSYAREMEGGMGEYMSRGEAYRINLIGFALCETGQLEEAVTWLNLAKKHWIQLGDFTIVDYCALSLARVEWRGGNLEAAWTKYQEVVAAFGRSQDRRGMAYSTEGLGRIAADLGAGTLAARLLGAAQRVRDALGLKRDYADEEAFRIADSQARQILGSEYESEWKAGYGLGPDRIAQWVAKLPTEAPRAARDVA